MKILDKTTQTYKELVLKPGGDTLPIGSIVAFASDTIPNGWLLCDGSVVSRTTYSELFNAIGLNYVEDGVEWLDEERFPLPNAKGKTIVGKDSTDTDFNTLGKTSGEKTHTLTKSELPKIDIQTKFASSSGGDGSGLVYGTSTGSSPNNLVYNVNYGSQAHNNLQPSLTLNYIIKAKNTVVVKGDVIQETDRESETNVYSAKAIDNKLKTNIKTGQEVATNEYIDDKQVFVKRINLGNLPNANTLILATGIPSTSIITKLDAMAYASNYTITLPDVAPSNLNMIARITFEAINSVWNVKITTGIDRSNYIGYANIYYTKNT